MADSMTYVRKGNTATVTATVDVSQLQTDQNMTDAQRVNEALTLAVGVIQCRQNCDTAAALDGQIAALQERKKSVPAPIAF